jgi:DUF4097 and DUF4098 domain-containing protein YvlB
MLKIAMLMGVIAMFTGGSVFAEKEFSFHKDNSFDGSSIKSIKIDMSIGEIALEKSAAGKVEVNFKNLVYASDQAEADKYNDDVDYKAELSGDKLVISIDFPKHSRHRKGIITRIMQGEWDDDYYPMLKVSIPDSKDIEIHSASADISASDVAFNLDVKSSSSDLTMENTIGTVHNDVSSGDVSIRGHRGPISIKGISSDIKIDDAEGDVDCYTSSGDGDFNKIKGNLKVTSTSGDNNMIDINGNLDVHATSGDVEVESVTGSVSVEAVSGDIKLKSLAATDGAFDISSVSGDTQIEISSDFKGDVQVATASGSINSSLALDSKTSSDSELRGHIGQGNGKLNISTVSGDITISKY